MPVAAFDTSKQNIPKRRNISRSSGKHLVEGLERGELGEGVEDEGQIISKSSSDVIGGSEGGLEEVEEGIQHKDEQGPRQGAAL